MSLFALDGAQALAAAKKYGTPCFVYRSEIAEKNFTLLRSALPPRVRLAYAVKANPHGSLLSVFNRLGASFDCASGGELERLRGMQVPGTRILFAGPGKTAPEIALALAMEARIQVDGIEDLEKIESVAEIAGSIVGVNLRIHPKDMPDEGSGIIGGSSPSAFGVDEEDMAEFIIVARRFAHVRLRGIQVFSASNELDADKLLLKHKVTMKIARAAHDYGMSVDEIDLGGGLGIPYSPAETDFDVAKLGIGLGSLLGQNPWFKGGLIVEPGRFLAGPCGVYLAGCTRVKSSRGVQFAILEGGINHLARPLLVGQAFPMMSPDARGPLSQVTLAGPLCTSLDRLGTVELPGLSAGNLLVFGQAGAYGFTEAMQLFLSRTPPQEIWL